MKSYNGTLFRPDWAAVDSKKDTLTMKKQRMKQTIEKRYSPYLTMAQVMEILPIGRSTLYEAVRTGQLCASHVGRRIVVSVDDLVEYIHKSD